MNRLPIFAALLITTLGLAGCSSNFGILKENDVEHGQYDGVKTYWALAIAALLLGLDGREK